MDKISHIYIHIPFCKQRCTYCTFKSTLFTRDMASQYVTAIVKEINERQNEFKNTSVESFYIGGGTPSIFAAGQIARIVNEVKKYAVFKNNIEFTVEVNPDSVDETKLLIYQSLGVNRISVGMQSCNDEVLSLAKRAHTNERFLDAIKLIKKTGFKDISVDVIVGLEGSNKRFELQSVRQAVRLRVKHISLYALSLDEGCELYKKVKRQADLLANDDNVAKSLEACQKLLERNDFVRYEISNFAKPNFESRHNKCYWQSEEYVGFGCGAVSFINKKRFECTSSVADYCNLKFEYATENITSQILKEEHIMLSLRTNIGVELCFLEEKKEKYIDELIKNKLAFINKEKNLVLTNKGMNVSNSIISELM